MIIALLFAYVDDAVGFGNGIFGPGDTLSNSSTLIGITLIGLAALVGFAAQSCLKARMTEYSREEAGLTGAQAARKMLDSHGLYDVQITHVAGWLTDHYNPASRTVNLSDGVYARATVAAVAVAAHECGHAVQHAQLYRWLTMRSRLVPMVNIGSRLGQIVLVVGIALAATGGGTGVAWAGLALFSLTALFSLVTLPVEFDASHRALAWLQQTEQVTQKMHTHARSALRWAAMTYVAAALSSVAMLAYYALQLLAMSARRERR